MGFWNQDEQFRKAPARRYGPEPEKKTFVPPWWLWVASGAVVGWVAHNLWLIQ